MSGGHFDYKQFQLNEIVDEIESLIDESPKLDYYHYSDKTLDEFKVAIGALKLAAVYVQRIDWLVSGDDGEDTFHKRLSEDIEKWKRDIEDKYNFIRDDE